MKYLQWMVVGHHGLTCPVQSLTVCVELAVSYVSEAVSIQYHKMAGSHAKEETWIRDPVEHPAMIVSLKHNQ